MKFSRKISVLVCRSTIPKVISAASRAGWGSGRAWVLTAELSGFIPQQNVNKLRPRGRNWAESMDGPEWAVASAPNYRSSLPRKTLVIWDVLRGKGFRDSRRSGKFRVYRRCLEKSPFFEPNTSGVINYWEKIDLGAIASLTERRLNFNRPPQNFWHDVIYAKCLGHGDTRKYFQPLQLTSNPPIHHYDKFLPLTPLLRFWMREFRHTFTSKLSSKLHETPWRGISFSFATCSLPLIKRRFSRSLKCSQSISAVSLLFTWNADALRGRR